VARVFITGSSDGLGRMAAQLLIEQGHAVVLHARNEQRGREAISAVPGAETVVTGDLASIAQTRRLAERVNALGVFDAVIHNAGVGYREPRRIETEDGLSHVFAVNTLAPYILTALIRRPRRLVYVSSELHRRGDASLNDPTWEHRPWRGNQAYSDTKLHDVLLAFAVARRWPDTLSNALEPGWVPTKMSGHQPRPGNARASDPPPATARAAATQRRSLFPCPGAAAPRGDKVHRDSAFSLLVRRVRLIVGCH